jgi:hypothetical protein
MTRITKLGAQRFKGKGIVSITDIHSGGDGLASLRGTEEFLLDLMLHPEKIEECERFLRKMWFDVVEELFTLSTSEGQEGSSGFLGWGPGKVCPLQEDILAMISPPMFKRFFLDAIIEQTGYLTCSMFHLDGPEALPHLDLLLCFPGYPVPTAWAYAELDRLRETAHGLTRTVICPKILRASLRRNEPDKVAAQLSNSFEPAVFRRHPALGHVKELLLRHGALAASLSGSGSTVYGLVRTKGWKDPMAALARNGFQCVKTSTLATVE